MMGFTLWFNRRKNVESHVMGLFQMEKHEMVAVHVSIRHEKKDPCNQTRWKDKWRWHNRGCVWANWLRSGQVGTTGRVKENSVKHWKTRKIVTVAHESVQNYRRYTTNTVKIDDKVPKILVPADAIIHTREEGPTVQPCGDSELAGTWINGQCSMRLKCRGKMTRSKNIVLFVEKEDRKSHL